LGEDGGARRVQTGVDELDGSRCHRDRKTPPS
jgi:hypothetical protein